MKLESLVIITKGLCLTVIPTFTVIGGGLDQIGLMTLFGLGIPFWKLVCAAIVAGAGGLLAFISQSFGDFMTKRSGSGGTQFLINPNPPPKQP